MSSTFERGRQPFRLTLPSLKWPNFGAGRDEVVLQRRSGEIRGGSETPAVERIRLVQPGDYEQILRWVSNPEVGKHLDPLPDLPNNWDNREEVDRAVGSLGGYYNNASESKYNVTPLAAVNQNGRLLGVGTIRWQGDPYVPASTHTASIERIIVDPNHFDEGIGTTLVTTMIELAFNRGYSGRGAEQIRAWVMNDEQARPWERNFNFFDSFGFRIVRNAPQWKEFVQEWAKRRTTQIETNRDALWLYLTGENYNAAKERNPYIQPCHTIDTAVAFRRI